MTPPPLDPVARLGDLTDPKICARCLAAWQKDHQ